MRQTPIYNVIFSLTVIIELLTFVISTCVVLLYLGNNFHDYYCMHYVVN